MRIIESDLDYGAEELEDEEEHDEADYPTYAIQVLFFSLEPQNVLR